MSDVLTSTSTGAIRCTYDVPRRFRPPAPPRHFVGRDAELAGIRAGGVTVLSGPAGVGKTALALKWLQERRSGEQLYVDLATQNLDRLLRALDLLLHREIYRLRATYQLSLDEFRGLYISDAHVDALIAERAQAPESSVQDPVLHQDVAQRLGVLRAEGDAAHRRDEGGVLPDLVVALEAAAHAVDEVADLAVRVAGEDDRVARRLEHSHAREAADRGDLDGDALRRGHELPLLGDVDRRAAVDEAKYMAEEEGLTPPQDSTSTPSTTSTTESWSSS